MYISNMFVGPEGWPHRSLGGREILTTNVWIGFQSVGSTEAHEQK